MSEIVNSAADYTKLICYSGDTGTTWVCQEIYTGPTHLIAVKADPLSGEEVVEIFQEFRKHWEDNHG